ncbi:MAG: TIGR04222 domain-containing membrane protein, partial [Gemmataceae bacterium]|nr:TIGR04222 domain-containing membrane protein [Gemmataceae bacterium]
TLRPSELVTEDLGPVERAVLKSLPVSNEATALKPVQEAVEAAFAKQAERFEREGITLPTARKFGIGLVSLVPLALVLFFLALPQLHFGTQAGRPVEYLLITTIGGGMVAFFVVMSGSLRLSNRGRAVLAGQKARHEKLQVGPRWEGGSDAGMAVALFGTAALVGSPIEPLRAWYPRQTSEASAGGWGAGWGPGGGAGGGWGGGGGGGGGD